MRPFFAVVPLDIAPLDKPKAEFLFGSAVFRLKIPALICKKPATRAFVFKILAVSTLAIAIPLFPESRYMKATGRVVDGVGVGAHWALIHIVSDYTGYSDDAIRAKKTRGVWKEGVHWRKAPDNRVIFNLVAIQKWMGGLNA